MSSASSPSTAFLNSGLRPRVERFLIDHEDEAPAGVDAGIRAIGRWHARRCIGRTLQGSGRDAAQGAHGADAVADPDFNFSRLELCDGCAVGLDGDEIDSGACGALARDRRLSCGSARGACRRDAAKTRTAVSERRDERHRVRSSQSAAGKLAEPAPLPQLRRPRSGQRSREPANARVAMRTRDPTS